MNADTWTTAEKKLARELFERAASNEEAELIADIKGRAAQLSDLDAVRGLQAHIGSAVREFQVKYDFRYSQLLFVFARLVREGRLSRSELNRLSDDKLALVDRMLTL